MSPIHTPFSAARGLAQRLEERESDFDGALELTADRRFVLLGEATHGTREFYALRAALTRRLIVEQGFDAIAVEGDWPDVWRINRFVQGQGTDDAEQALSDFERFPQWMWRNQEVMAFIAWLKDHNRDLPAERRVGVYGLDLYSMYRSADAVISYLEKVDPEQATFARWRYSVLDHVREPQAYGYEAATGRRAGGAEAAIQQLLQVHAAESEYLAKDGLLSLDQQFFAERNAAVVVNAEAYYRAMFGRRSDTWNLRDSHMRDTLFALGEHRQRRGGTGRIVVWAHNSHVGDARATEMHESGEWNLGQLVREAMPSQVATIGFTTYTGHVAAASEWGSDVERKWVRPALEGSYEQLFHSTHLDRFFLSLRGPAAVPLAEGMLERAIGVIYLPRSERASHYFNASLSAQFDAIFHVDETEAVEPLDVPGHWDRRNQAAV